MAKVTVTGGRGVLGRALVPLLQADGHEVTVLTRRPDVWPPDSARRIVGDLASGGGLDAAVRDAEGSCTWPPRRSGRPGSMSAGPGRWSRRSRAAAAARTWCMRRSPGGPDPLAVLQAEEAG
jgi:NAD(P)-dependent dehydrogenase (short-subunit alcohol dehydrogenase family)